MAEALEEASLAGSETVAKMAELADEVNKKISMLSDGLASMRGDTRAVLDAMKAVGTAASLQAGVDIPLNVDFFKVLGRRNYEISAAQRRLASNIANVVRNNASRFATSGLMRYVSAGVTSGN